MSRSHKKNPILKYAPNSNIGQKFANRRVRRYKGELPTKGYGFLKKIYDPWNVHDHVQRETLREALNYRDQCLADHKAGKYGDWIKEKYGDENKVIQNWKKWFWRK